MLISASMPLNELAELMGYDAIKMHAEEMRDILVERFIGLDTADIPNNEWRDLLYQVLAPF